ncbi:MAG: TonB-dependent receptor [Hyphomonadaceae bacterium]
METTEGKVVKNFGWPKVLAVGASAIAISASAPALAQTKVVATDGAELGLDEKRDVVVITGSRLSREDVDTVRPGVSVDPEELDKRAFTNLSDALKELPAVGQGIGPTGDQNAFTVGQSYVDLFNLGTQRTLTLVNGRRFVSSNVPSNFSTAGGLQVDYNSLPVALLERIEVVPLAGAAVYGSDAIAGTINVILKDDFEGADFSAQYGEAEAGDLAQWQVQGVIGANFADGRGNVAASVEYNKQDGALVNARPRWTQDDPLVIPFGARLDADGDGDADQEYRIYVNQNLVIAGPYGTVSPAALNLPSLGVGRIGANFYQFTQTGDLATCTPGATPGASSPLFAMGGTCGFDLVDDTTQIRSPVERINFSSMAHYDITDHIRLFAESTVSSSNATELVNQGGFNLWAFGGTSGALRMNTSNPFLSTQARGVLEGALGPNSNFFVNRLDNDLVSGGANKTQNFTWRVASGLEGDFELAGRKFNWEVSSVFGRANIQAQTFGIVDGRLFNALDAVTVDTAYLNSLVSAPGSTITDRNGDMVVNAADALIALQRSGQSGVPNIAMGSIICNINGRVANGTVTGYNSPVSGSGAVGTALPFATGCRPLNIFGDASVVNTPEALEFITGGPRVVTANNEQRVFTGNLGGEVFQLPAGWVTMNVGYETRRERARFTPDLGSGLTITRGGFATYTETGGQTETEELFGEILVPVFNQDMNVPFLNRLEFNGSVRSVEEKNKDINALGDSSNDSTAWEIGGRWSPISDLTFRASNTRAIRSPSLVELYTPEVGSFSMAQDPCDQRYSSAGADPTTRRANCIAAGINPSTFVSNAVSATIPIVTSGNASLTPEESKAYTVGVIYQPNWVDRLALTLDYFHIEIENRISPLSLTQVLNACYDSPSYPNTPACSDNLFTRDGTGQITFGRTTSLNASDSLYEAVQGRVNWGFDVAELFNLGNSDFGDVTMDLTVLNTLENRVQVLNELPSDPVGTFTVPDWKSTFDLTYNVGDWRFFWRTLWQSKPVFLSTDGASYLVNLGQGDEARAATSANIISGDLSDYWMHNASLQYTISDRTSVMFSVNNVFDSIPKFLNRANASYYPADMIGRYFTVRVRHQF